MDRDRTKRIYDLHAWVGVTAGLFLYVVSLSGVFALFGAELATWEDERARIVVGSDPVPVMPLVEAFAAGIEADGDMLTLAVDLPTAEAPFYRASALARSQDGETARVTRRWNPNDGAVLPDRGDGFVRWIVDFHRNLMLPRTWGRAIVGVAGVLMMLMVVSGLVSHRKIVRGAYVWRFDRSLRVLWSDSHKAVALWGTPFSLMIAFTGAWLGFLALFVPTVTLVANEQDAAALRAVAADPPAPTGPRRTMYSIDAAAAAVAERTGLRPIAVQAASWGREGAHYHIVYAPDHGLVGTADVEVDAVTGTVDLPPPEIQTGLFAVPAILTSLHYATYGGVWLKAFYALLGLVLCGVTSTGLVLWLERRLHGHAGSAPEGVYRGLARMTVGVSLGLLLATVAIFYVDRLYAAAPEGRLAAVGIGFFAVWLAAACYAAAIDSVYRSCRHLLLAAAAACILLPVFDALSVGALPFGSLVGGLPFVAGVEIVAVVTGAALLVGALWMPKARPERARRSRTAARRA